MASLDVSEALDCLDFQDAFSIIHRRSIVNDSGENELTETQPLLASGIIQAAGGKDLERVPEAFRSHEAIRIYYKGDLSSDEKGDYSDVVLWDGKSWQVKIVDDWSNWGEGYVKAICVMEGANLGE